MQAEVKEQGQAHRVIGFQGLLGAYSHMAIEQYFGNAAYQLCPLPTFEAVYEALIQGNISDALLPFENSLAGMIHENLDLLVRYPVQVRGEQIQSIAHCILLAAGQELSAVRRVISHPQALAQCAAFLRARGIRPENFFDTAGAAAHLAAHPQEDTAAIASERAAQLYGLEIAVRGIADRGDNLTRFYHLSRASTALETREKKSHTLSLLVVQGPAGIGPLASLCSGMGIRLVQCEARPIRVKAWNYEYFCEIEASPSLPVWTELLAALEAEGYQLAWKGSYESDR